MGARLDISIYEDGELIEQHKAITEEQGERLYWMYFSDYYESQSPYRIVIDRKWVETS